MGKGALRWLSASVLSLAIVAAGVGPGLAVGVLPGGNGEDTVTVSPTAQSLDSQLDDSTEARLLQLDQAYVAARTAGDSPLTIETIGKLRAAAADAARGVTAAPAGARFNSPWTGLGPNPIVQVARSDNSFIGVSGRVGALAIRKNGQMILGAAQGGIWLYNSTTGTWTPKTDTQTSLAIGALAVASDDLTVYAGTGEGALSGDSYYGNGILKSTDGGFTWSHVSGDFFVGVSTARLAVDPTNANHVYAAILRGRGGDRRVSPPVHSAYGIWESKDGGVTWTLLKAAPGASLGATEIRIDPQTPTTLYSSFWGDAIYKSTDGGATWAPIMNGLPTDANFAAGLTRFDIGLSHPSGQSAVLYTGFSWVNAAGKHQKARVFKSTDEGATWVATGTGTGLDSILDYCAIAGDQCFYDNVVEVDPTNPQIVFLAGSFGYNLSPPSGGIYRSDDGGATWINLGWNQHPDFHAVAFDPSNTANVLIGSDGGVWYSTSRGGRNTAGAALSAVTWQDLNGTVIPSNGGVTHRTGLQISQFTSAGTVPTALVPVGLQTERFWGGTQDNGTLRKSVNSQTWFDASSGDGGQVVVDQTDHSGCALAACFVYGTYFGVSLYRFTDGGGTFSNQFILNGINTNDRSDFYIPVALNQLSTNQLLTATYRLYRTDNAKAPSAGDVKFKAISPDLTGGCLGAAPNGARGCVISAIGIGGGTAAYTGSEDGYVYMSTDALSSDTPTWTRVGLQGNSGNSNGEASTGVRANAILPGRPVAWIAVDRSNYRVAYIAYNGYNAATPHQPGHVFKTTDGGASWNDISSNLPDNPVNSITIDPSFPNTLYAATDVGPFVTYDGGSTWFKLGSAFPNVAIDQIDLDTYDRIMMAGTHGRGAFRLQDNSAPVPALVISKTDSGVPVGPGTNLDYTITVRNIGNAAATGVTVTDPIPANTSFVAADSGGANVGGTATWTGLTVAAGGSISVHLTVRIDPALKSKVTSIVDDGYTATSAQGPSTSGSPHVTPIAPAFAVTVSPATQTNGARPGNTVTYAVTLKNLGFNTDHYNMSTSGGTFPVTFFDATCTTATSTTPSVAPGATTGVCIKVSIPASATGTDVATITATSAGNPSASGSAIVKTIAITVDTLLVDEDGNTPDTNAFYTTALTTAGVPFITWDLNADPNLTAPFMESFKNIVWFTGNSFPAPISAYETSLTAYLNNGGHLFVSGQDLLDGAAGTSPFVANFLHVTWDGSEKQNDKATKNVNEVAGTLTAGVGTVPLDATVMGNTFMDEITPNGGAVGIFTDDAAKTDGLSFTGTYKVVFLAFPLEEFGTAAQKADLLTRVMTFFGS